MSIKKSLLSLLIDFRYLLHRHSYKNQLIIVTFHQVAPTYDPLLYIKNTFNELDYFKQQLSYIKDHFNILPLHDAVKHYESRELKGRHICLTFDDGDKSLEIVVPLLQKMQIPATFFINTAYLAGTQKVDYCRIFNFLINHPVLKDELYSQIISDYHNAFLTKDREFYFSTINKLVEKSALLNSYEFFVSGEFLASLDDRLFTIGLHGHEHIRYSLLTYQEQMNDLILNMNNMKAYRAFIPIFALPFGQIYDYNKDTIKVCLDLKVDLLLNAGGINHNVLIPLNRIPGDHKVLKNEIKKHNVA